MGGTDISESDVPAVGYRWLLAAGHRHWDTLGSDAGVALSVRTDMSLSPAELMTLVSLSPAELMRSPSCPRLTGSALSAAALGGRLASPLSGMVASRKKVF